MRHAVKTQMFWEETKHTLRDYLMTTSIPIIFEKLLEEPDIFENENWENFMRPKPAPNRPAPIMYERTSLHDFVWEYILKDRLFAVFYDRLLGSQTEPERYVQRSESYAALFNDIIGGSNCSNDLYGIIERFFGMVKDYLCRNLPGHESDYTCLTTQKVLSACRDAYAARRWDTETEKDEERKFYINFGQQTFSLSLLFQFDEMALDIRSHPKSRHFMVLAELLQVLFIYVYMVEYIKYYPKCKGDTVQKLTFEERTGRSLCLFTALAAYDYSSLFFKEKAKRDENKRFVGK